MRTKMLSSSEKLAVFVSIAVIGLVALWFLVTGGGLAEVGEPCESSSQCTTQICCRGICEQDCQQLGIGEYCIKDESVCQTGLTCCTGTEDDHWLCRPGSACEESNEGTVCTSSMECTHGLTCCNASQSDVQRKCRRATDCLRGTGAECTRDDQCVSYFCCGGQCAASPETCSDANPLGVGAKCKTPRDCLNQVCSDAHCRASLDPNKTQVGQPCSANDQCATNVCCNMGKPAGLTCGHPDDCLRTDGSLCSVHADCKSAVCCQKVDTLRRKCVADGANCLREPGQECSPALPCVVPYTCCKGNSLEPDATMRCRLREKCLLQLGEKCTDSRECDATAVCCAGINDRHQMRCRKLPECAKTDCPVEMGILRSCTPGSQDSCPACKHDRICRDSSLAYMDKEGSLLQTLPGNWCLPPDPSSTVQCQPSVSQTAFVSPLERWGCHCSWPKLIGQSSLGGPCNVVLACNNKGRLVHKTTHAPWSETSQWNPSSEGKCDCNAGYEYKETEDGRKMCISTSNAGGA